MGREPNTVGIFDDSALPRHAFQRDSKANQRLIVIPELTRQHWLQVPQMGVSGNYKNLFSRP